MGLVTPADDAEDRESEERPLLQPLSQVLGVLRPKGHDGVRVSLFVRLDHPSAAVQLDESQPSPVLVPAVDEDRCARIRREVSDAPQSVHIGRSLRFLVEG
jgi:hypothetical protein